MRIKTLFISVIVIPAASLLHASEGMWIPSDAPANVIEELEANDNDLEFSDIYNTSEQSLKDNTLFITTGYTGTLISANGLILIPYDAIPDKNDEGFIATEAYEEIPLRNLQALQLDRSIRITAHESRMFDSIKSTLNIPECKVAMIQATSTGRYYLNIYTKWSDFRLVYLPPRHIAEFTQRHGAAFALIRLYTDRNNRPAQYNFANTKAIGTPHAVIAPQPVDENESVFAIGYPNKTNRMMTSAELHEYIYTVQGERLNLLQILDSVEYRDYSESIARIKDEEYIVRKQHIIADKASFEREFTETEANGEFHNALRYTNTIPLTDKYIDARKDECAIFWLIQNIEREFNLIQVCSLMENMNDVDYADIMKTINTLYDGYNATASADAMKAILREVKQRSDTTSYIPSVYFLIDSKYKGSIDRYVETLFKKSIFTDTQRLTKYLDKPDRKKYDRDMLITLYRDMINLRDSARAGYTRHNNQLATYKALFLERISMLDTAGLISPDANYTMRIGYGKVQSCSPANGIISSARTTLDIMLEERHQDDHLIMDDAQMIELALSESDTPITFLTTIDMPKGRMGETVYNSRGEMVGMLVSGNSEADCSTYFYNERYQRTIALDIYYMLTILEKYSGFTRITDEIEVAEPEQEISIEYTSKPAEHDSVDEETETQENTSENEEDKDNSGY